MHSETSIALETIQRPQQQQQQQQREQQHHQQRGDQQQQQQQQQQSIHLRWGGEAEIFRSPRDGAGLIKSGCMRVATTCSKQQQQQQQQQQLMLEA
ncbi:hypothetical protein Emag_002259 [Eimeria magna]